MILYGREEPDMPLWLAAVLVLSCRLLRRGSAVRVICIAVCASAVLACACYLALTLLFVDAVRSQPPAP